MAFEPLELARFSVLVPVDLARFGLTRAHHFSFHIDVPPSVLKPGSTNFEYLMKRHMDELRWKVLQDSAIHLVSGVYCKGVSVPSITVETEKQRVNSRIRTIGMQKTYDTLNVDFFHDRDGALRRFIYWWMFAIEQNDSHPYRLFPNEYKSTMRVRIYNDYQQPAVEIIFEGAFPSTLGDLPLAHASENEFASFQVTIDYDRYVYKETGMTTPGSLSALLGTALPPPLSLANLLKK